MLSIKTRIRLKQIKKKLISAWYTTMKPIAYIINKIEKFNYKRKEDRVKRLTDEQAIRLCSKILIKQLIRYRDSYEEFIVAEWCSHDYNMNTIRDFIMEQNDNKDLRSWGYKLPWQNNVDRIEELTELLRLELEKNDGIQCKYVVNDKLYSYHARGYKKTLVVELLLN